MSEVKAEDVRINLTIDDYAIVQGMLTGYATLLEGTANKLKLAKDHAAEIVGVLKEIDTAQENLRRRMTESIADQAGVAR